MTYTKNLLFYIIIVFFLFLSSCGKPRPQLVQQQIFTFGTLVDIAIWTDKPDKAKKLIEQLSADFEQQHHRWHPSDKGSLVVAINQQIKQSKTAIINAELVEMVQLAIQFSEQSNHLFNPAIGQLIDLWHFDLAINQIEPNSNQQSQLSLLHAKLQAKPPTNQQLQSLVSLKPLMSDLTLNKQQLHSSNPAVKLNLGAFAKGYAIDLAIKKIKKSGFNHALVNAGGDIKAIGSKGEKAWQIGIRNPFYQQQNNTPVLAAIALNDNESIMTSGDYERYFNYQGKRYHHIIDPQTGYPANGFHSVTVVHSNAALADAAATALFIAGPENWQKIAKQMGVDKVILVTQKKQILISKKLMPRLSIQAKIAKNKIQVIELD